MPPISTKAGGTTFAFPDVCMVPSPGGPVPTPFPNTGMCQLAEGTVLEIKIENAAVIVESSLIPWSTGDEPGTLGGVISGLFRGCVKFRTASARVYAKGKRVVMQGGVTAHNGDNANMPVGTQIAPSQVRVIAMQ
ncbi:MAG: DUF4150 domain-containing protein [Polyangiaceae bacterium]|nr:DUF4150 domain-containing protein [Polyangiaceae bacterium]